MLISVSDSQAGPRHKSRWLRRSPMAATALMAALSACAPPAPASTTASPAAVAGGGVEAAESSLPPIPEVRGALAPRVTYPAADALIAARDSNFIFGSVGSGDARLTINGR